MPCSVPFICTVGQSGFPIFIKQTKGLNTIKGGWYLTFHKNIFQVYHSFFRLTWSMVYYLHNHCNIYFKTDKTALSRTVGCLACHRDG